VIVFDLIHVSSIHNATIQSGDLLATETQSQLLQLANDHEFNLAYNASDPIRAIAGSTLAVSTSLIFLTPTASQPSTNPKATKEHHKLTSSQAQILENLNTTINGHSKLPFSIQFGAYASFLSFFGLSQLPSASSNFTGIVNYASSMAFELITNATVSATSYPSTSDISVRFLFTNGSAAETPLTAYPLFGQSEEVLGWGRFVDEMGKFAVGDQETWCTKCGNTTGVCASADATTTTSSTTGVSTSGSSGSGMSRAVAGVIGAMVTLAVILGVEGLVMALAGLRLVRKNRQVVERVGETAGKVA
jgi:hypothetical protein